MDAWRLIHKSHNSCGRFDCKDSLQADIVEFDMLRSRCKKLWYMSNVLNMVRDLCCVERYNEKYIVCMSCG